MFPKISLNDGPLQVMRNVPGIGTLTGALEIGFPKVLSTLSVLMLAIYVYAVVCMSLFGGMDTAATQFLSVHANFGKFPERSPNVP
jgi:hypothetical protein